LEQQNCCSRANVALFQMHLRLLVLLEVTQEQLKEHNCSMSGSRRPSATVFSFRHNVEEDFTVSKLNLTFTTILYWTEIVHVGIMLNF
jgi:hypothetical protein